MKWGLAFLAFILLGLGNAFGIGGPFRQPSFDNRVVLSGEDGFCLTRIHGTWPNLPHNPTEWINGGRTELTVEIKTPGSKGKYDQSQIALFFRWPQRRYEVSVNYSGFVEFSGKTLTVQLREELEDAGTSKGHDLSYLNGTYSITDPDGCSKAHLH